MEEYKNKRNKQGENHVTLFYRYLSKYIFVDKRFVDLDSSFYCVLSIPLVVLTGRLIDLNVAVDFANRFSLAKTYLR